MFKFTARTHSALIAHHALGLGLECTRDPILTGVFNVSCSCENDKEAFDRILEEQGFGLNALTWKVVGVSAPEVADGSKCPEDARWQTIVGGGLHHIYLIRPRDTEDHKIYGVRDLTRSSS